MDITVTDSQIFLGVLFVLVMFIFYLVVRELRLMKTGTRRMELELEREKIDLIKQDLQPRNHPFSRLSPEQFNPIKDVEIENQVLETDNYAKEKLIESRLRRLELYVHKGKLGKMIGKIEGEEKKVK
ncbi:MAG: hypothetical protein ABFC24_11995 [Methanoregulaceae archaeon]